MILMLENQNSSSPNALVPPRLMRATTTQSAATYPAGLRDGKSQAFVCVRDARGETLEQEWRREGARSRKETYFASLQNETRVAAAASSAGRTSNQLAAYVQPTARPNAGLTSRVASVMWPPGRGRCATISPREVMTHHTSAPTRLKASSMPRGPAIVTAIARSQRRRSRLEKERNARLEKERDARESSSRLTALRRPEEESSTDDAALFMCESQLCRSGKEGGERTGRTIEIRAMWRGWSWRRSP